MHQNQKDDDDDSHFVFVVNGSSMTERRGICDAKLFGKVFEKLFDIEKKMYIDIT